MFKAGARILSSVLQPRKTRARYKVCKFGKTKFSRAGCTTASVFWLYVFTVATFIRSAYIWRRSGETFTMTSSRCIPPDISMEPHNIRIASWNHVLFTKAQFKTQRGPFDVYLIQTRISLTISGRAKARWPLKVTILWLMLERSQN